MNRNEMNFTTNHYQRTTNDIISPAPMYESMIESHKKIRNTVKKIKKSVKKTKQNNNNRIKYKYSQTCIYKFSYFTVLFKHYNFTRWMNITSLYHRFINMLPSR